MSRPRVIVATATGQHPEMTVKVVVTTLPSDVTVDINQFVKATAEDAFMHVWDTVPALTEVYEEVDCQAYICHGPGHQSKTRCTTRRPHAVHYTEIDGDYATWVGDEAMTGFFDDPPKVDE